MCMLDVVLYIFIRDQKISITPQVYTAMVTKRNRNRIKRCSPFPINFYQPTKIRKRNITNKKAKIVICKIDIADLNCYLLQFTINILCVDFL